MRAGIVSDEKTAVDIKNGDYQTGGFDFQDALNRHFEDLAEFDKSTGFVHRVIRGFGGVWKILQDGCNDSGHRIASR